MAGLDIRIGHDKQPAPVVPSNQPLYNLQTGKILTDSGGTELVSEQTIVLASEAVSSKSTSVVFTDEKRNNIETNVRISGTNFFILNDSILSIQIESAGSGFTLDGEFVLSGSGDGNAVVEYEVDAALGIVTSVVPKPGASGSNYVGGTEFIIPSPAGGDQNIVGCLCTITQTATLVSGTDTKFTKELQIKNRLLVPTGELNGVVVGSGAPAVSVPGDTYNIGDIVESAGGGVGLKIKVDGVDLNNGISSYTIVEGGSEYSTGPVTLKVGSAIGGTPAEINVIVEDKEAYETRTISTIPDDSTLYLSVNVTNQKPLVSVGGGKFSGLGALFVKKVREVNPVLPIAEQFPLFSEVSSTILGIPKAETQLSLFSNVSSYGLDTDEFLFYRRDSARNDPNDWVTRRNREYGNHYLSGYEEDRENAAIVIRSFPTSYAYPYPPGPSSITSVDDESHRKFCNFLKLGMLLYDYYKISVPNPTRGGGASTAGLSEGDAGFAFNFIPYTASFASAKEYFLGDIPAINNKESPFYDNDGALITPLETGEEIYYIADTTLGVPNPGAVPIGTVRYYSLFDDTIHFNEDVGFLFTQWRSQPGNEQDEFFTVIGANSKTQVNINGDLQFKSPSLMFRNLLNPLNKSYNSRQDLFNQIDTWEGVWKKLTRLQLTVPGQGLLIPDDVENLSDIVNYIIGPEFGQGLSLSPINDSLPGRGPAPVTRAYLVSRKSFRYQPGRISGYTFGVRAAGDASTTAVRLEWGIANDTDELVFQIEGANINIVRRSVVPLSDAAMERSILDPGTVEFKDFRESGYANFLTDETTTVAQKISAISPFFDGDQIITTLDSNNNSGQGGDSTFSGLIDKPVFETKISRDLWNGDPLNGNGPSGWNLSVEDVTMYKIEFGWYGAIGVRFYVYTPVENGEARWVAVHTLVIENQLGRPSMGDPYYKFKYAVINDDPQAVDTPQFVYKYGTSCYIDGGDDGTITVNSITSAPKIAPTEVEQLDGNGDPDPSLPKVSRSTTVVGLLPKTVIFNTLGKIVKNKQSIFPRELSLTANGLTEISLVKCVGCPGFAHTYQTNVSSGYVGDERYLEIVQVGTNANGDPTYDYGIPNYDDLSSSISARLEAPLLGRSMTGTAGSDQLTVTGFAQVNGEDDPSEDFAGGDVLRFLRIGDILDPSESGPGAVWPSTVFIKDIDPNTNIITASEPLPTNLNGPVTIQPLLFYELDSNAKLIANRIFLTYLDVPVPGTGDFSSVAFAGATQIKLGDQYIDATGVTETKLWTVDRDISGVTDSKEAIQYKVPRALQQFERIGDSDIRQTTYRIPCRLSQYKSIAASTFPIYGKDNSMLVLIPRTSGTRDSGTFSSNQYTDFRLGITPFKPTQPGGPNNPIVWERSATSEVVSQENFTEQYKLYAERYAEGIFRDAEGFEQGENTLSRIPPFTVDYRIPDPPGTNTGRCAYCNIKVDPAQVNFVQQIPGTVLASLPNIADIEEAFIAVGSEFDPAAYYLRASNPWLSYNAQGGEIGYNFNDPSYSLPDADPLDPAQQPQQGSGVRIASDFVQYTVDQSTFNVVKLSGDNIFDPTLGAKLVESANEANVYIYTVPVVLESYRRLSTKSFDFNPFPLYFFIEMRDNCRVNSPTVREFSQIQNTYNPRWIGSPDVILENGGVGPGQQLIEVGEIGQTAFTTGDQESSPPNFTAENRLSSALVDVQSTSQLRPYEVVDRFYVGGDLGLDPGDPSDDINQTKQLDLSTIFAPGKEVITPDLLNTTAYFFVATSRDIANTTVAGTLNYIEQQ